MPIEMSTIVHRRIPRTRRIERGAGFTLTELAVSLGVLSLIMIGVASLFQLHSRLGRQQLQVADMQQAARGAQNELVRMTRMAGRGGLGRGTAPNFLAFDVRNSVSASGPDSNIALGVGGSPTIRPGTDVLTLRGIINSPLYQLRQVTALTLDDKNAPKSGTLVFESIAPPGFEQDLTPLAAAIAAGVPEPLLISSGKNDRIYAVVALSPASSSVDDPAAPTRIVAAFDIGKPGGTALADQYLALSAGGVWPRELQTAVFSGIVEEYRYYVREQAADPNAASSPMVPRLARARFLAGTEVAHPSNPGLATDVADGIIDLQVAVGIDVGNDGRLDEDVDNPSGNDDWLYNDAADVPMNAAFWNQGASLPNLSHLRITTMARTDRPDPLFNVRPITRVEDHFYMEMSAPTSEEERRERLHRRRQTTTLVDMRNLG